MAASLYHKHLAQALRYQHMTNISAIAGSVPSVDLGSVAQGFARGFVQGAGDAVQSIGGIPALLNGTAHASLSPVPDGTVAFNDSVGGAATGFGQGLGGQLVLVARQLLDGVNIALPGASAARRSVLFLSPSGIAARQSSDAAWRPGMKRQNERRERAASRQDWTGGEWLPRQPFHGCEACRQSHRRDPASSRGQVIPAPVLAMLVVPSPLLLYLESIVGVSVGELKRCAVLLLPIHPFSAGVYNAQAHQSRVETNTKTRAHE